MPKDEIQLAAWGLADDLIDSESTGPVAHRYLLGKLGDEPIAVADAGIREVIDLPKVTPWLEDPFIVGVFALRGDIYTLTDPTCSSQIRRLAVVLELPGRYVAVGLDEMSGVQSIMDDQWREFESASFGWARRIWDNQTKPCMELDPNLYIESFDQRVKEN